MIHIKKALAASQIAVKTNRPSMSNIQEATKKPRKKALLLTPTATSHQPGVSNPFGHGNFQQTGFQFRPSIVNDSTPAASMVSLAIVETTASVTGTVVDIGK
ncbi:hypothetical protein CHS0354_011342, partial [Potamilus streckersoni]